MNNQLSLVLEQLLKTSGITETFLSHAINLPRATINRIKTGIITDPKSSTLTKIADYFCISVDQLLGRSPITTLKMAPIIQVPLLELSELQNNHEIDLNTMRFNNWMSFEYNGVSNSLFAYKVTGDAMWPYLDEKSIVIVDTRVIPQNRSFVLVRLATDDEILLRMLLIDGNTQILQSMNTSFSNITLTQNDKILGVVIHVKKDLYLQR